jgi:hypothetical protein
MGLLDGKAAIVTGERERAPSSTTSTPRRDQALADVSSEE